MRLLDRFEVDASSFAIELAIDATPDIDPWCSGPDWVLPVYDGFAPTAESLLLCAEDGPTGYALLARYQLEDGRSMVAGLEPLWGFASPLIGSDIIALTGELCRYLASRTGWDVLVLPGMPNPSGPDCFVADVVRGLAPLGEVKAGDGITRQVADLSGGYEAWFGRRSSRFRKNLRRAKRRAADVGLLISDVSKDPAVFERLLAIEAASWKGLEDSGITSPEMTATYRAMVARLTANDRLRARIATLDGRDVGYILGGVRAGRYRGLQISYTADVAALSVGHLLQAEEVATLCATGIDTYDLGMDLDYKRRWADRADRSMTLVIERR